jgi:hypothetical protein
VKVRQTRRTSRAACCIVPAVTFPSALQNGGDARLSGI